jgi:secreted trypsin-like serine protease
VRRISLALAAAILIAGALATPATAISYGQVDSANTYANTGALIEHYSSGWYVVCSGTLISSTVFLTAAHCIDEGQSVYVSFDLTINEPVTAQTNTIYHGTGHPHPDAYTKGGESDPLDVAVVVLDDPVQGIAPAPLPTENLLSLMSNQELKSATFVAAGYGTVRDQKQGGWRPLFWDPTRRWAYQTVNSLEPAWLNLSMNTSTGDGGTCYGDSGGPHFLGDVVVAVTVTGDTQCKSTDKDYRVDTPQARAFLAGYVSLP